MIRPVGRSDHADVQALQAVCRRAGLKMTPQRLAVFRVLTHARNHPSVEAVHHELVSELPSLALDTVYRTLATLEAAGVCQKLVTPDGCSHYDPDVTEHAHAMCRSCGKIVDLEDFPRGTGEVEREMAWGVVERCQVTYVGVCRDCLA